MIVIIVIIALAFAITVARGAISRFSRKGITVQRHVSIHGAVVDGELYVYTLGNSVANVYLMRACFRMWRAYTNA